MKIKKHILITRSILFWQDGFMSLLWLGIIASLLFLIGIELETVFYFSPTLKMNGLYIIYILLGVYVIHWLVKYFRSESDQLVKYKVETISLYLGKVAFPDKKRHNFKRTATRIQFRGKRIQRIIKCLYK